MTKLDLDEGEQCKYGQQFKFKLNFCKYDFKRHQESAILIDSF